MQSFAHLWHVTPSHRLRSPQSWLAARIHTNGLQIAGHLGILPGRAHDERIVIHVSDSMLKELSTAQTNLLGVFHKNRTHILHLSDEEMEKFIAEYIAFETAGWKELMNA